MSDFLLTQDKDIPFPHFAHLKASAGSGKTHNLTLRFVLFLLSDKIKFSNLSNILAVTFSNNACKEMKVRVLTKLKALFLKRESDLNEISKLLTIPKSEISEKAGLLIDEILDNYSDFQIKTIDSFMASVFKASAIDLGFDFDFEILMDKSKLMAYAFDLYLKDVTVSAKRSVALETIISEISDNRTNTSSYVWDPKSFILSEILEIYSKLSLNDMEIFYDDYSCNLKEDLKLRILALLDEIKSLLDSSGLVISKSSAFPKIYDSCKAMKFTDIVGKSMKTSPANKPKSKDLALKDYYEDVNFKWEKLGDLVSEYSYYYAKDYYIPFIKVYKEFFQSILSVKKRQGKVFIDDINKELSNFLSDDIVPDIYIRLGDRIYHYLIDEFQDTSPVQWKNLLPLLSNSLSQEGSLFVVGDTKQAIYGFREADYKIMKITESINPFKSCVHKPCELNVNYRSTENVLKFNETVFKDLLLKNDTYNSAAVNSGLCDYTQKVLPNSDFLGVCETYLLEKDKEKLFEREKIYELLEDLRARGYSYGDIAILTFKNNEVLDVTSWLNAIGIDCVSYSSLDVRKRPVTREIVSFLTFLNSPMDDLSFSSFLLGDIFLRELKLSNNNLSLVEIRKFLFENRNKRPLYKAFQESYNDLWNNYFDSLFKASGYLPPYDLLCKVYRNFKIFENFKGDEDATFIKLLEVMKDFDGRENSNLRDFLEYADDESSYKNEWSVFVPDDKNKVKVMTVHKSKGLGFPAVITLLYGQKSKGYKYIVNPLKDEKRVALFKVNKNLSVIDKRFDNVYKYTLSELYDIERQKEFVSWLNSLYVGFTRPKKELYVVCVKGSRDKFPFDILPTCSLKDKNKYVYSSFINKEEQKNVQILSFLNAPKTVLPPTSESLNLSERKRGDLIHRILYYVNFYEDFSEVDINSVLKKVSSDINEEFDISKYKKLIEFLFENESISDLFKIRDNRKIFSEKEFVDTNGNTFRPDRVLVDDSCVTVIDFKTGHEKKEEVYKAQVLRYMTLLKGVFCKENVKGVLLYVDLSEVLEV